MTASDSNGSERLQGEGDEPMREAIEGSVERGGATWVRSLEATALRYEPWPLVLFVTMTFPSMWVPLSLVDDDLVAVAWGVVNIIALLVTLAIWGQYPYVAREHRRRLKTLTRALRGKDGRARRGCVQAQYDDSPVVVRAHAASEKGAGRVEVTALPFVVIFGEDAFLVDVPFVEVADTHPSKDLQGTVALYSGDEVVVLLEEHEDSVAPAWFTAHKGSDYRRRAMRRIVATVERPVVVLVCERGRTAVTGEV